LIVGKDDGSELATIESSVAHGAGKGLGDGGQGAPVPCGEPMHHRISLEHRHAQLAQRAGYRRFAHADRAGEADDAQESYRPCATSARNSSVTSGSTPNQALNPGRA